MKTLKLFPLRSLFTAVATALLAMTAVSSAQSDATLSDLTSSGGAFDVPFNGTFSYTATVPYATTSVTVTPTATDLVNLPTITVDGNTVASGSPSGSISLGVGATNVITTVVVSQDLSATNTYTLTVTRSPAVATLSDLTFSGGAFDVPFNGSFSYTATVPYATTSVTATPTATDPLATITVNGNIVTSGNPSGSISLGVGATNVITTVVVSQDLSATNTYTLTVTRLDSANLTDLVPSAGTLTPSFSSGNPSYAATVPYPTTTITVTPTAENPGATITVNGNAVASGNPSGSISLGVGATNVITTVVVSQDLSATNTYTLTVTRTAASVNADLASLVPIPATTFTPIFASGTTNYTAGVPNQTTSMTVTPTSADATATITVNGIAVTSGNPSASISLGVGSTNVITTVVTAQDATTTKTYTLTVTRSSTVVQTFNTAGTTNWTCPSGVTSIQVECWGGAGAGGAGRKDINTGGNTSQNGGGGGGGAYALKFSVPVTPGSNYNITIPAAAVSGANGTTTNGQGRVDGGAVTFTGNGAVAVTAVGGQGGANAYVTGNSTTGQGGGVGGTTAASVGDVTFAGGAGANGTTGGSNGSGGGGGGAGDANPGSSATTTNGAAGGIAGGGAGGSGRGIGNVNPGAGFAGATPGGGGGGGHNQGLNTRLGGTGGLGQIVLTYNPNVKTNNTDNLNLASSWTVGVPISTDMAIWNGTVTGPNTTALGANLTFGGIFIQDAGGLVTINGPNTLTLGAATTDINMFSAAVDLTLNCPLVLGADNVWNIGTSRTLTLGGAVSGAFPVTKSGAGTAIFSTANSYTGSTTISLGTLKLGANNVIPDGTNTGNVFVSGTLDLNTFSETINGLSGAGSVDTVAGGNPTLTVGGNDQSSTFSGVITDTAGTLNLSKSGTGTLTLTGNSSYSGTTTVSNGTLRVNGSTTSATSVKNGGALGGSGTVNATVTVESGGVVTAGDGAASNLKVSGLTFNNGAVLNIGTLFSYQSVATVVVSNALTLGGVGGVTINLPTTPQPIGIHHLLQFGSGTVTTNLFTLGTVPTLTPNQTGASLQVNGNFLDYVITGYDTIWTGAAGTQWSTTTLVTNWTVNGTPNVYFNGDSVLFNDAATTKTVDISVTNVTPGSVRFTNTIGNDYTVKGSNAIAGFTGLTKEGTGTLTISNANTFSGGVNLKAGRLVMGNGSALGSTSASTVIAAGATLDLNGFAGATNNPVVVSGGGTTGTNAITSSAAIASPFVGLRFVTLNGDTVLNAATRWDIGLGTAGGTITGNGNKLTLYGTNDLSLNSLAGTDLGDVVVSNRTLFVQGNTTLGRTTNTVFVGPGSSLNLFGTGVTIDKPLALNGGTLANGSGSATYSGPISVNANSLVSASTLTISGGISGTGGLTQTSGSSTLTSSNSFSGGITITGGSTVTASNSFALGTGDFIFNGGTRLTVRGGFTVTNPITIGPNNASSSVGMVMAGTTGTATLTGPITINNSAAAGGHFGATINFATLVLAGPITSAVQVTHRAGTVVFSGGGTGYSDLFIHPEIGLTAIVGANNGIATTATVINNGPLDLNGFNQSLVGVAGTGSLSIITNTSATSDSTLTTTGTSAYAGKITDSGTTKVNLVVSGGAFTLTGANTYSGVTTVNGGTLLVNSPGSLAAASAVNVNTNGTLGGTGTIAGTVTNNAGGTLAPGTSIGTLTIGGDLVLTAGSTNTFEVDGSGPANDQIVLGASVNYGGELNIVPSGTFTAGQTFTLFSGAGATTPGNFSSPILASPGAGLAFSFTNGVLSVVSTGPTLTSVTPNPVTGSSFPVTLGLTGSGFTGATDVLLTNLTAATGASYVPTVNSDTSISVSFVPGVVASSWDATVVNGGSSAQVGFTVTVPTAVSIDPNNLRSAGAGSVVLSGTGGTPGYSYSVVSSTNLVPPVVWTPVVTNVFDGGGNFSYTNTVSPSTPVLFLRIEQ